MKRKAFFLIINSMILLSISGVFARHREYSFTIDSKKLFKNLGISDHHASFTAGIGDINGDGINDVLIRTWSEGSEKQWDSGDRSFREFPMYIYAYTIEGKKLWEYNTRTCWKEMGGDPCCSSLMIVWDFDKDGKDEVVTTEKVMEGSLDDHNYDLVMLKYNENKKNHYEIINRKRLKKVHSWILGTVAFLDGTEGDPYIVIAHGPDANVTAFNKNFIECKKFSNPYGCHPFYKNFKAYDFDEDGKDELEYGMFILDENLNIYLDGTSFGVSLGAPQRFGISNRSFIADIDPDNDGYEWYLQRVGHPFRNEDGSACPTNIDFHTPKSWKGVYLISLNTKKVLWHFYGKELPYTSEGCGFGRMHRGWIGEINADKKGLEIQVAGQYFKSWQEFEAHLKTLPNTTCDLADGTRPYYNNIGDKPESCFLLDCKGNVIYDNFDKGNKPLGYPIYWDDDPDQEFFMYRSGKLLSRYPDGSVLAEFQGDPMGLSGECTITDFIGDWREEIIKFHDHRVYIYSNDDPTDYNYPNMWKGHHYRLYQASIGNGLPKPCQPDAGWPWDEK